MKEGHCLCLTRGARTLPTPRWAGQDVSPQGGLPRGRTGAAGRWGAMEGRTGFEQLPQVLKELGWLLDVTVVPPPGQRPDCTLCHVRAAVAEAPTLSAAMIWPPAWAGRAGPP